MITQKFLKEVFDYNETTGRCTFKIRPATHFNGNTTTALRVNNMHAGKVLGTVRNGYLFIELKVEGKRRCLRLHRLIWIWVYGTEPDCIDHIDHNRSNNRISNLRSVTKKTNFRNLAKRKHNTSGYTGVCFHSKSSKHGKPWMAKLGGKYLGTFKTKEEAHLAWNKALSTSKFHANHGI